MSMFCDQCQETKHNIGCEIRGICGKDPVIAGLQDYLLYALKGLAFYGVRARALGIVDASTDLFVAQALFATLTNVNFDQERLAQLIRETFVRRDQLRARIPPQPDAPAMATCAIPAHSIEAYVARSTAVAPRATHHPDPDIQSLRELLTYGLKGLAAYCDHAYVLDRSDASLMAFLQEGLLATTNDDATVEELIDLALHCGRQGVTAMTLLDEANTSRFGHPQPTSVSLGVDPGAPGILISGHDLLDLYDLLEQTAGTGINVYTHGEMLPAHAYPVFKQYPHLVGNYGGAWWEQQRQFESFNGPILMTTNCLQKPRGSYRDRIFTTGMVGWEGIPHIADRQPGQPKDFGPLIERARTCVPPVELESGQITVGFAHATVLGAADQVLAALQSGALRRFVVMAGCDGPQKERSYYTNVAQALPNDTIILTAGCAKYRYNKLNLGTLGALPRVLDAGQCNDCYSLVKVALALTEAVGAESVNDLPISYDIAWYEQKAVLVLLSLLSLGVKGIRLGPTLPAFLSPNVADFLVNTFDIKPIDTVANDIAAMLSGV